MRNKLQKESRNCTNIKYITYRCSDEDLGKKEITGKEKQRKAYAKIFEKQALSNMKERLKTFNQFQTQLKNQNYEKAENSE